MDRHNSRPAADAGGCATRSPRPAHTGGMPVRLHHIVIDTHDLPGLARFWTQALGWKVLSQREREIVIGADENAPAGMCFMPVTDPKTVKNRVHLDLTTSAQDRDQEIERLLALGGAPGRHRADGRRVLDRPGRPRRQRVLRDTPKGKAHPVRHSAGRPDLPCLRQVRALPAPGRHAHIHAGRCSYDRAGTRGVRHPRDTHGTATV